MKRKDGYCDDISLYNLGIPLAFPQHGRGKKHEREIILEDWQTTLVQQFQQEFVIGLLDSDGCRWKSPRKTVEDLVWYYFANRSEEIIDLFCRALEEMDIVYHRWLHIRPPGEGEPIYRVQIAKRSEAAKLEEFVPLKR